VAQGHGRVEQQAQTDAAQQQRQRQLQHIAHVVQPESVAEALAHAAPIRVGGAGGPGGGEHGGQHGGRAGGDKPHRGDDELAPQQAVDAHRQGEHEIALVGEQIVLKALDHQHKAHDQHGQHGQKEQEHEHGREHAPQTRGEKVERRESAQRDGQQNEKQRHHGPRRGAEFVLDEFS